MLCFGSRITVSLIRSGKGDCIHVRFLGAGGKARNIVIDSGPSVSAAAFRKLYNEIIRTDGELDSVIITHSDEDHLGGLLKLAETEDYLHINQVYLNAVIPSKEETAVHSFHTNLSARQNQELAHKLLGARIPLESQVTAGQSIELDGAVLTVLAPDEKQLGKVLGQLKTEEAKIQKEFQGVFLSGETDWNISFDDLMERDYPLKHVTASNEASVVLVFECDGYTFLFAGDAPAKSIVKGLEQLRRKHVCKAGQGDGSPKQEESTKQEERFQFQLVKLPHHGSAGNISDELLSMIQADAFVICADGSGHPDKMTVSKLLKHYGRVMIYSNYSWWRRGFLNDDDRRYITEGRLDFANVTEDS